MEKQVLRVGGDGELVDSAIERYSVVSLPSFLTSLRFRDRSIPPGSDVIVYLVAT